MTKSNKLKPSDEPSNLEDEDTKIEKDNSLDLIYTLFSYIEDNTKAAVRASIPSKYPNDIPEDNIEATLLIMKTSLNFANKQKK